MHQETPNILFNTDALAGQQDGKQHKLKMNGTLKVIAQLLFVLVGSFIYWNLGYSMGLPLLLFLVSLAIVGKGNRLVWSVGFPFLCIILAGVIYAGYAFLPPKAEFMKLFLSFVLLSVIPGVVLWVAVKLKRARSATLQENSNA